jgi:hypothetical protein
MQSFKNKYTKIKGTSEVRRLPRLGKIRLGVKAVSKKTGNEYPKETSYFVCPDEVEKAYKDKFPDGKITELDVLFPINDPEIVFPQAYKWYGQTRGLKCIGDGKTAMRFNEDKSEIKEIECPCELLEQGKCQRRAHLLVILPGVNMGGIYQIDIGSFHSIVDINSGIDYVRALSHEILGVDRFALIPLVLKREARETHFDGGKQTHYTLHLYCNLNAEQWNQIKGDFRIISPDERIALPPVEDINPAFDEGTEVVEVDEENEKEEAEAKDAGPNESKKSNKEDLTAREKLIKKVEDLLEKIQIPEKEKEGIKGLIPTLNLDELINTAAKLEKFDSLKKEVIDKLYELPKKNRDNLLKDEEFMAEDKAAQLKDIRILRENLHSSAWDEENGKSKK